MAASSETGSLPPASTAKQAAQSRQGGDEGGFAPSFRGFAGVGATRDARDVRTAPYYRSRSRLPISGGSVCADGFLVGVPFTLQWPPMAVWAHHFQCFRRAGGTPAGVHHALHAGAEWDDRAVLPLTQRTSVAEEFRELHRGTASRLVCLGVAPLTGSRAVSRLLAR